MFALAAIVTAFVLVAEDASARVGGGLSSGTRGARTFSAPPPTRTAPNAAQPMQRSMTQPNATAPIGQTAARPGLFGGGLFGGLAAGFLGAGLFGLLFGHGLFGGMGGFGSLIGLVLQLVLIFFVARLIMQWWQRRSTPAFAGGPAGNPHAYRGFSGMFGGGGASTGEPLTIDKADYDMFERLLGEVQAAYSEEDLNTLRARVTPEMLSYFSEDLAENASRGLVNRVSGVRLLQGDLAEAWREGDTEYATVAMRFALTDSLVERRTGRLVEGGRPEEVTELWTFMRARPGHWLLSAIQQT
ncbi:MAG TPA: TIM44-like domain-containing protein [Pseudolabrys sp.]|nr:TIM44-like domain-containing protein [Pseudolabrys sp.]